MRTGPIAALVLLLLAAAVVAGPRSARRAADEGSLQPGPRFEAVDLFITPAGPLAAYQLEFHAGPGQIKIVGLEGGDHPAYAQPPYYDPAAMQGERIIIGALSTSAAAELPSARFRAARVHLMIEPGVEPAYVARLQTAAGPGADKLDATVKFEPIRPADPAAGDPQ